MQLSHNTRIYIATYLHAPLSRFRMSERNPAAESSEICYKYKLVPSGAECKLMQILCGFLNSSKSFQATLIPCERIMQVKIAKSSVIQ